MNLQNIFSEIENVDPEVYEKIDSRRHIMRRLASMSGKVALASIPFAIGSIFQKAYGRNTDAITDVLQFALTLEYLEAEFYVKGNAAPGLIPAADQPAFQSISAHETAHVNFLKTTITSLGQTPVAKPNFDFTAGSGSMAGPFLGVFTNYTIFLAVSQTFEDTGVRAYKGQATALQGNPTVLSAALRIHSVEARHASHVRYIRQKLGAAVKPWITLNQSGIPAPYASAVQPSYNGEEAVAQGNPAVTITGIGGQAISANAASESFDEPLTRAQVLSIVTPFIY